MSLASRQIYLHDTVQRSEKEIRLITILFQTQKALFFKSVLSFSYLWFNHQSNCKTFHNYINLFLAGELLRARYNPIFPLNIEDHTTGLKDPSSFRIVVWVLLRPLSIDEEG